MINEETFKNTIAKNLTKYRKINNLTQLDLAEKLNYSDKAISKWERGESLPDIYTLSKLAEFYGITINDLCNEDLEPIKIKHSKKVNHIFIILLSVGLVWFIATLTFVILKIIPSTSSYELWPIFIIAIPSSFILLTIFTGLWYNNIAKTISVSGLVWGLALLGHIVLYQLDWENSALVYVIAIPFQILVILWFTMFSVQSKKKQTY